MIGWIFASHRHTFGSSLIPHAVLMYLHGSAEEKKVTSDSDKTYQKRKRAVCFVCNHISLKSRLGCCCSNLNILNDSNKVWKTWQPLMVSTQISVDTRHDSGSEAAWTESVYSLGFLSMLENKFMTLYLQVLFLRKKFK